VHTQAYAHTYGLVTRQSIQTVKVLHILSALRIKLFVEVLLYSASCLQGQLQDC
jgi:hypothetical protein